MTQKSPAASCNHHFIPDVWRPRTEVCLYCDDRREMDDPPPTGRARPARLRDAHTLALRRLPRENRRR